MAMSASWSAKAGAAARTARLLIIMAAVLTLGSCQVLEFVFGSVFPATAVLIKGQVSLAGKIPSTNNNPFTVRVIETGGFGYVVVAGSLADTGNTAFFFDLSLNKKGTFTNLAASGVGVDASGLIAVGSLLLNPDLTQNGTMPGTSSLGSNDTAGVDTFASSGSNIASISVSGSTLNAATYNSTWTGAGSLSATISATQTSLQVSAVLDDGGSHVILVLIPSTGNGGDESKVTAYFLKVAKGSFNAASLTNLLDASPHRDNMDGRSFGFAQGSIFAYDSGSSGYVRIDPATASTQARFYSGSDNGNTQYAYRVSGGSFYGYDSKARTLTKYSAWW